MVTHSYWLCWPTRGSLQPYCSRQLGRRFLRCKRPTTAVTIGFLHELFARFGVPDCVFSDNGTQFISAEFKDFCKIEWSGGEVRRHDKKSTEESTSNTDRQSLTTIPTGEPKYTFNRLTGRNPVCQKIKICIRQINPETKTNTTEHVTTKRFLSGQKIFFKIFKRICRTGKKERSLAGSAKWYI